MSDDEEAGPPLVHQGTGLSLTLPEADGNDRGDVDGASGQMAELMLALEDGQEWKTSVDVSFTVEFVKALARNHFVDLKDADYLVRRCDIPFPGAGREVPCRSAARSVAL